MIRKHKCRKCEKDFYCIFKYCKEENCYEEKTCYCPVCFSSFFPKGCKDVRFYTLKEAILYCLLK